MKKKDLQPIKTSGFKVPKDYFSNVEDHILREVSVMSKSEDPGFIVPESYFETLDQSILEKITQDTDSKVVRLFPWKKVVVAVSIAASIVLMFNIFIKPSESVSFETIEVATIENYIEDEELSSYELAALFTEDELNTNNFIDHSIPESSIEEYLLDNVDLETLIIEQ